MFWTKPVNPAILGNSGLNLCIGDTALLNVGAALNSNYLWQDGSTQPTYNVTKPGLYKVTISNDCGSTTVTKYVAYQFCLDSLFVPSAFTPNNDGKNDVFKSKYYYTPQQFSLIIYNRYGEIVFKSEDITKGWNGLYRNLPQQTGAYIYIIRYKSYTGVSKTAKGTFLLLK